MENHGLMHVFSIEPELIDTLECMDTAELSSFAECHEGLLDDASIETHILAHTIMYAKTNLFKHIETAFQRTEGWFEVTDIDDPDRERRIQMLDSLLAQKLSHTTTPKTIAVMLPVPR